MKMTGMRALFCALLSTTVIGGRAAYSQPMGPMWVPFTLGPAESAAGDEFGLSRKDAVTVIVYNRLRVVHRWTFGPNGPTDADIDTITAAVREMIDGPPKKKAPVEPAK